MDIINQESRTDSVFLHLRKVILLCLCIICMASCSKLRGKVEPKPHWFKYYSTFSEHDYQDFFLVCCFTRQANEDSAVKRFYHGIF